ncbi:mpv17-like protein [Drosophila biarmipes]|uniref:mpv17-like protein n=1 Tax=Drosophila biarmipes TaxID=125945 RepID=UPI0007E79185|nr:mpv17-like protein [Drosophila biarmipes]
MSGLKAFLKDGMVVAGIMGLGDTIAQLVIEKKPLNDWDTGRTLRFGALGLVFVGPMLRQWYLFLEARVPKSYTPMRRGVTKMVIDQVCFAPPFSLATSFLVLLVNGEPTDQIRKRLQETYPTIMARNYMLWPAAQMINFSFVPLRYQVFYAQTIALVWNCYLSLILNR